MTNSLVSDSWLFPQSCLALPPGSTPYSKFTHPPGSLLGFQLSTIIDMSYEFPRAFLLLGGSPHIQLHADQVFTYFLCYTLSFMRSAIFIVLPPGYLVSAYCVNRLWGGLRVCVCVRETKDTWQEKGVRGENSNSKGLSFNLRFLHHPH